MNIWNNEIAYLITKEYFLPEKKEKCDLDIRILWIYELKSDKDDLCVSHVHYCNQH